MTEATRGLWINMDFMVSVCLSIFINYVIWHDITLSLTCFYCGLRCCSFALLLALVARVLPWWTLFHVQSCRHAARFPRIAPMLVLFALV